MDSIIFDTKGEQELGGAQSKRIAYNRELLLREEKDGGTDDDPQEGEVQLFGLKLDFNEVLSAVSPQPTAIKKLKPIAEPNHNYDHDRATLQENVAKDLKGSRLALNPDLSQRKALPTVGKRQQPILNRVSIKQVWK